MPGIVATETCAILTKSCITWKYFASNSHHILTHPSCRHHRLCRDVLLDGTRFRCKKNKKNRCNMFDIYFRGDSVPPRVFRMMWWNYTNSSVLTVCTSASPPKASECIHGHSWKDYWAQVLSTDQAGANDTEQQGERSEREECVTRPACFHVLYCVLEQICIDKR